MDFAANIRVDADVVKPYGTIASYSSTSDSEPRIPYYMLQFKAASLSLDPPSGWVLRRVS